VQPLTHIPGKGDEMRRTENVLLFFKSNPKHDRQLVSKDFVSKACPKFSLRFLSSRAWPRPETGH
jgi:hypothetical protein